MLTKHKQKRVEKETFLLFAIRPFLQRYLINKLEQNKYN